MQHLMKRRDMAGKKVMRYILKVMRYILEVMRSKCLVTFKQSVKVTRQTFKIELLDSKGFLCGILCFT